MHYKKAVYPQVRWISLLLGALIALGVWQGQFVMEGMMSNIYLNGGIVLGMAFGCWLHYAALFSLRHEYIGLEALSEAFEDNATRTPAEGAPEPTPDRLERLRRGAQYFSEPKLLGGSFDMLYSELYAGPSLSIPSTTAKMLIEDFENRLTDKISFINYVSGLMVLLGLLGTFIGLLDTVGSVGDIIGSIDLSGGGGPEQIQALFDSLAAPLGGMATGFSSSLFGLIASLALGVMTKICFNAFNDLKHRFEIWINRVSQIETLEARGDGGRAGATAGRADGAFAAAAGATGGGLVLASAGGGSFDLSAEVNARLDETLKLQGAMEELARVVQSFSERIEARSEDLRQETREMFVSMLDTLQRSQRDHLAQTRKLGEEQGEALNKIAKGVAIGARQTSDLRGAVLALVDSLERQSDVLAFVEPQAARREPDPREQTALRRYEQPLFRAPAALSPRGRGMGVREVERIVDTVVRRLGEDVKATEPRPKKGLRGALKAARRGGRPKSTPPQPPTAR